MNNGSQTPEGGYVFKRDGRKEEIIPQKITSRVNKLCYGLDMSYIDPVSLLS
jgi:ribonucleoside-diphosphate reductase subunit M1